MAASTSFPVSSERQSVEPDRRADRGCVLGRAQTARQTVVAAAADRRSRAGRGGVDRLEHEAGVIVEVAHESGAIFEPADVQAARGEEADALVEGVDRPRRGRAWRRRRVRAIRPNAASGSPEIVEEAAEHRLMLGVDPPPPPRAEACSRKRSAISPALRPPTLAMPAMESNPPPAPLAPAWSARSSAASTPDWEMAPCAAAVQDRLERPPLREPAPHPAQPDLGQAERAKHAVEYAARRRS